MSTSEPVSTLRRWLSQGTELFLGTLAELSDDQLTGPVALPGWTGRHVVGHVHANAGALGRLTQWAATGVETPMYASRERRDAEIEELAQLPPATLRELVATSAAALDAALDALPEAAWSARVRTAQGRDAPAREIPWMRCREVFVHAVDLGGRTTFADLPPDVVTALLVDVVTHRPDGERAELAAWLTGRATTPPALGAWL